MKCFAEVTFFFPSYAPLVNRIVTFSPPSRLSSTAAIVFWLLPAQDGKRFGAVEICGRVDNQVFELCLVLMLSLAITHFFYCVIFLDIFITLAYGILNIYFAFLAFREMLLFFSFQD